MKKLLVLMALAILLASGCAHKNVVMSHNHDFKTYKTAYIEILPQDEFNLGTHIIQEMSDLGFEARISSAPSAPTPTDLLVKYSYDDGWDFGKYLKSYQVFFFDARTTSLVASISYHLDNATIVGTEARIAGGFDDFRKEAGLPPHPKRPHHVEKAYDPSPSSPTH